MNPFEFFVTCQLLNTECNEQSNKQSKKKTNGEEIDFKQPVKHTNAKTNDTEYQHMQIIYEHANCP